MRLGILLICLLLCTATVRADDDDSSGSHIVKPSPRRMDVQAEKAQDEFDRFGQEDQGVAEPVADAPVKAAEAAPVAAPTPAVVAPAPVVPVAPAPAAPIVQKEKPKPAKVAAKPASKGRGPASLGPQPEAVPVSAKKMIPPPKTCAGRDWEPSKNDGDLVITVESTAKAYTFEGGKGVLSPAAGKIVASKSQGRFCEVEIEHNSCPAGAKGKCRTEIKYAIGDDNVCPELTREVDTCTPFAKAKRAFVKTLDAQKKVVTSKYAQGSAAAQ